MADALARRAASPGRPTGACTWRTRSSRRRPTASRTCRPTPALLRPPAEPGPDGHFDNLAPGTEGFLDAHCYACVRRVLDICEGYVGREIPWYFEPTVERLEIVPLIPAWDNAQSGFGFLELGESDEADSRYCYGLNFDAIAHEVGHLVLFGEIGLPQGSGRGRDFFAYHEAVADFISLLGLLHFDTALDRLLRRTQGNLLIHNELDRFAETSDEKQVRSFSNSLHLSDVSFEVHDRSKPFGAALFDCLIEVHQALLFDRGLSDLDPRAFSDLRRQIDPAEIERELTGDRSGYEFRHFAIKAALAEARDIIGEALVRSWRGARSGRPRLRDRRGGVPRRGGPGARAAPSRPRPKIASGGAGYFSSHE